MNKYATFLTDNQFLVIKNIIPEIESKINELDMGWIIDKRYNK